MAQTKGSQTKPATKSVVVRKQATPDQDAKSPGQVTPQIVFRENKELIHHLFKGQVAVCLKADKFGPIPIRRIEHVHHFHSHNSNGHAQKHCHPVAGHVHEWEYYADPVTGELKAKCGPPLKKVVRPGRNGLTKVSYERITIKNPDDGELIPDNHTHEMTYEGSDRLSLAKIQAIQQKNSSGITPPTSKDVVVHTEPSPAEGYQMTGADRKEAQE